MVRGLGRRLGELLHDGRRRRDIRVAESEVDDVAALAPQAALQLVDGRENVRRQVSDAAELHRREATTEPGRRGKRREPRRIPSCNGETLDLVFVRRRFHRSNWTST